jgi:pilus assembly protein CpaB
MRVDVLVTGRPPNDPGSVTSTVLQNIQVLSAGQTIQADAKGQAIQAPTVTLLVTPEQAETLTLSNSEGRIQLVLRNSSDQTIEKTPGRAVGELYGRARVPVKQSQDEPKPRPRPVAAPIVAPAPPVVAAAPPPPPPPDQVVVIRGTTKTVETLPNRVHN